MNWYLIGLKQSIQGCAVEAKIIAFRFPKDLWSEVKPAGGYLNLYRVLSVYLAIVIRMDNEARSFFRQLIFFV